MKTTFSHSESTLAEAYWTLLSSLSLDMRRALAARLEASIAQEMNEKQQKVKSLEEARAFIQSLSMQGGKPVPADENGIEALISEKYL